MNNRNSRELLSNQAGNRTAGKGDADRSPGWRGQYDAIAWGPASAEEGFEQVGPKRFRKVYGNPHVPTRTLLSRNAQAITDLTIPQEN